MKHQTKEQLLIEIRKLKAKNAELEKTDTKRKKAEDGLLQRENYLSALNQSKKILLASDEESVFQQTVDILGKASNASRTYIFINHTGPEGEALMSQKAEYCITGIKPEIDNPDLQNLRYDEFFNRWNNTLSKGEIIFGKIKDFPVGEKEFLEIQDIKAVLVIPIITNNEFIGFIGFDNCISEREWDEAEQNFLHLAANDLAQFIEKTKTQEQLIAENIRFQTTMDALDAVVYVVDMDSHELLYLNELGKTSTGNKIGDKCYLTLQEGKTEPCDFCTNHLLIDENGDPKEPYEWEFQNTITKRWYHLRDKAIHWPDGRIVRLEIATDITDSKRTEKKITKLSSAVKQSANTIVITDIDGNIEYTNPKFTDLTGYSSEEVIGLNPRVLNAGTQSSQYYKHMWQTISSGEIWKGEFNNKKKNGELFWENVTITPIKSEEGKIINYLAIKEDITALKESEQRLHTLINAAPDAIFFKDGKGRWIEVNRAGLELFDLTNVDYKAKTDRELSQLASFYKEALLACEVSDETAWNKKSITYVEEVVPMPDGNFKVYDVIKVPLFNKDNSRQGLVIIGHDITNRKKADEDLLVALKKIQDSEKKYRLLITNTLDVVWTVDLNMNISYVNEAITSFLGYTQEEFMGMNPVKFTAPESLQKLSETANDLLTNSSSSNTKVYRLELKQIKKDGKIVDVDLSANAIFDENGKIIGFQGRSIDITERKKVESELKAALTKAKESDRLKTAFLQNISHEIRTPMNGIIGFISLLKSTNLSVNDRKAYIEIIDSSGTRLLNTLNDIMDISKLETGQMRLNLSIINTNKVLEEIYSFFKPEVENKGMKFDYTTSLPSEDVNIRTDHEKFFAIFTNLVKNSIKYSHEGRIDFGYEKKGDNLEFYVKDTGVGIPKDRMEAIFDRFVQADIEDIKVWEGSGLGLSICKAYVEMLDGKIWVESTEWVGTQFYFTIPYTTVVSKQPEEIVSLAGTKPGRSVRNLKVLIAEDEEVAEEFLSIILKDISSEILHVKSGLEAVKVCEKNPDIDLILMDIRMPVLNGYDATKQIREINKDVIIIAQTAHALTGDREKAIAAGCDDYITKPIDKDELLEMIEKLV